MTGELFLNGADCYDTWGVFLEEGSEDKLFLPAPLKPFVENKSRSEHGKQVLMETPVYDERDVTIVFCFANTGTSFCDRLTDFVNELSAGVEDEQAGGLAPSVLAVKRYNPGLYAGVNYEYRKTSFSFLYSSSTELSSQRDTIGKVAIRLNEPNPYNRTVEYSHS